MKTPNLTALFRPIIITICAVVGAGAVLLPSLPSPKKYPADMLRSFYTRTNITTQVNGDMENVEVVYFKRIEFTGTDPSPLFDEPKTIMLSTNIVLFKVITERPRVQQKRLTMEEWKMMQPMIPAP